MSAAESYAQHELSIRERTLERLTGKRMSQAQSDFEILEVIEKGLSSQKIIDFVKSLSLLHDQKALIKAIGLSERALYRRIKKSEPLTADQSSRVWRFAEILTKAEDVFGDSVEAVRWMSTPALGLEGHKPINLITTQVGYELVNEFLNRLDYGVYI
ncbi:antitoxin Xre/MbcA/ParS toxin-binding domain-containing protein [Halomonas sp. Bachu 37]|uniref:type II RES/Xre toxin-antitoxin system antitoxin n=1 Tax=Halomonas kashgarensis TaxID=3084920 RepID=UPI003217786C